MQLKKFRTQYGTFLVEGKKLIEELRMSDFEIEQIYSTENLQQINSVVSISEAEMKSISALSTPSPFLAVVKQKKNLVYQEKNNLTLVLDQIKDPGNLGTIIRTADWFGISQIICSHNCVDVYNPKVVQATMGSIFRVSVFYDELEEFFKKNKQIPVFAADLDGKNVLKTPIFQKKSFMLMGSESFGITKNLHQFITQKITIPSYGSAESLNVSVATGILCSIYRQQFT
ncbi:MAG: RNA methyltransferase [Flavobacteriales bacterium]|nr:RNA methyltransferase [Flavobacteriales bacterium]